MPQSMRLKELDLFNRLRGDLIAVSKYLHGEKRILGPKRLFRSVEKGSSW